MMQQLPPQYAPALQPPPPMMMPQQYAPPPPPQQQQQHYAPPPIMLDVVVQYRYCGHRGSTYEPPSMHKAERRLRITVDDTKSVSAIRDEVLSRKDIIPAPYQYLGNTTKSGTGFELDEKDLVRYVSLVVGGLSCCAWRAGTSTLPLTRSSSHTPPHKTLPSHRLPPAARTWSFTLTTGRTPPRATPSPRALAA